MSSDSRKRRAEITPGLYLVGDTTCIGLIGELHGWDIEELEPNEVVLDRCLPID